jgi:hypothetical protein
VSTLHETPPRRKTAPTSATDQVRQDLCPKTHGHCLQWTILRRAHTTRQARLPATGETLTHKPASGRRPGIQGTTTPRLPFVARPSKILHQAAKFASRTTTTRPDRRDGIHCLSDAGQKPTGLKPCTRAERDRLHQSAAKKLSPKHDATHHLGRPGRLPSGLCSARQNAVAPCAAWSYPATAHKPAPTRRRRQLSAERCISNHQGPPPWPPVSPARLWGQGPPPPRVTGGARAGGRRHEAGLLLGFGRSGSWVRSGWCWLGRTQLVTQSAGVFRVWSLANVSVTHEIKQQSV